MWIIWISFSVKVLSLVTVTGDLREARESMMIQKTQSPGMSPPGPCELGGPALPAGPIFPRVSQTPAACSHAGLLAVS